MRGKVPTALACLAAAAVLSACGGGGGTSAQTAPAATTASPPAAAQRDSPAAAGKAPVTAKGLKTAPKPPADPAYERARAKAGAAANFVVRRGDNSVPTYGSQASSAQRAAATAALGAYLQARAGGDWSTACSQLAKTVQKQIQLLAGAQGKGGGCATAYAKLSAQVPAAQRADPLRGNLAAFRVKGDKAFALFYGPGRQQYMVPMAREAGAWKVTQLAPIPYPVGSAVGSE